MPIQQYGVLAAQAVGRRREGSGSTPHYQIHVKDSDGVHYRVAVNVLSQTSPPDLLYVALDDFQHPVTARLPKAPSGWTGLPSQPDGQALDFIRGNLFDPAQLKPLPPNKPGPDNDLADLLDHYVQRAIGDPSAVLYAFGQRWGPEPTTPDKIFDFSPGNGVHDIHMNQGNTGRFTADDGVWQDGGLLLHFPSEDRWVAVFLAFQSQSWHTDDSTGHTIAGPTPPPASGDAAIRVVGALVTGTPVVTLLNASPVPVDLTGWHLADQRKSRFALSGTLPAGTTLAVRVDDTLHLSGGGALTVLDAAGLKVHGVSYTAAQAAKQGWTIVF